MKGKKKFETGIGKKKLLRHKRESTTNKQQTEVESSTEMSTTPGGDDTSQTEMYFTDIMSSDSDDSSIDLIKEEIMAIQKDEARKRDEENLSEEDEKLERMAFYSLYLGEEHCVRKKTVSKPLCSDTDEDFRPYTVSEAYMKDLEAEQFIMQDLDDKEFENFLSSGLDQYFGLDDIDENVSIRTLAEKNFKILKMDGPTRKIALIFDFKQREDVNISAEFREFMDGQIEKFGNIGGVLLMYEEIGIHIIEATEYTHLRHFPMFFDSQVYKKLTSCKVLGIEELSAMKSFKQYASYVASPPQRKESSKERLSTYDTSIKFVKKFGKCLNKFLKFVYNDKPNIFEDNEVPQSIQEELPSKEYLTFIINGNWTPGLRGVESWFNYALLLTTEADDAEFVWPPRSDHFPVHELHLTPEEEQKILLEAKEKMKNIKFPGKKKVKGKKRQEVEKEDLMNKDDKELYFFTTELAPVENPEVVKGNNSQSSIGDSELDPDLED